MSSLARHMEIRSKNSVVGNKWCIFALHWLEAYCKWPDFIDTVLIFIEFMGCVLLFIYFTVIDAVVICLFDLFYCERFSFPFHFVFTFPFRCEFALVFLFVLSCFHYKKMNYDVGRHKCETQRCVYVHILLSFFFKFSFVCFGAHFSFSTESEYDLKGIIKGCRDQQKCPFFLEYNFWVIEFE